MALLQNKQLTHTSNQILVMKLNRQFEKILWSIHKGDVYYQHAFRNWISGRMILNFFRCAESWVQILGANGMFPPEDTRRYPSKVFTLLSYRYIKLISHRDITLFTINDLFQQLARFTSIIQKLQTSVTPVTVIRVVQWQHVLQTAVISCVKRTTSQVIKITSSLNQK